MNSSASLQKRIVVGVLCFTILASLTTTLLGFWMDEQAEQHVWEAMLEGDLGHRLVDEAGQGRSGSAADSLQVFGQKAGRPIPPQFAGLAPGVHDEVALGDRVYVVAVEGTPQEPAVLALDISAMEHHEASVLAAMIGGGVLVVLVLAAVTWLAAQWLVRPLSQLSSKIAALHPGVREQQLDIQAAGPAEVTVISTALNQYLRDIDSYVDRERRFLTMASHELRTPIAVIAGAAEVALEQPTIEQMHGHVSRIAHTTRGMRELVAMLLALARDPARLQASAAPVDLQSLVPRIVADHEHLLAGKELTIACGMQNAIAVAVPEAIATAVIGNLVRNAIENSSCGTISIDIDVTTMTIEDPGSAMSAEERSQLHIRLLRAGQGSSSGIGLGLVERLCEHMGWTLALESRPFGGARVRLTF